MTAPIRLHREFLNRCDWARTSIEGMAREYVEQVANCPRPERPLEDLDPGEARAWRECQIRFVRSYYLPAIDALADFCLNAALVLQVPADEVRRQAGGIFHRHVERLFHPEEEGRHA